MKALEGPSSQENDTISSGASTYVISTTTDNMEKGVRVEIRTGADGASTKDSRVVVKVKKI